MLADRPGREAARCSGDQPLGVAARSSSLRCAVTARLQHPSGRPVRRPTERKSQSLWRCPLDQAATPRLRAAVARPVPVADAVGFLPRVTFGEYEHEPWTWAVGFVRF